MIFATIGTQLPFNRLLSGLNSWAARNASVPVFAQVGSTSHCFRYLNTVSAMSQSEFRQNFQTARLVVAHAGMGTILSALELGKPLVIMPRRTQFGEHRNDHQQDTAHEMARFPNVVVARDGEDLHSTLDRALDSNFAWPPTASLENDEPAAILEALREFVWAQQAAPGHTVQHGVRPRA